MKKLILFLSVILITLPTLRAVEGMWLPSLIHKNMEEMQAMGLELSALDLYNPDGVSFKDAIVRFGRGCTGAFISEHGLLITNHHCGYGQIQRHSTVENDYLTHGFWATNKDEELPNEGLTITILVRMEDVTDQIRAGLTPGMTEKEFGAAVDSISRKIERAAAENGRYSAQVNPFYFGNEYYLFVYQIFRDVRMVGAPPSSIGKYGGDIDNWMWPRHSGDFMLFRVYADENNEPADYSPDNVPYRPAKHFSISNRKLNEHDFTMVYGFPGRTNRYLTSHAVDFIMNKENPMGIEVRTDILRIYEHFMAQSDTVRIQYAGKHAGISNAWKRWMGENRGLAQLDAVNVKKQQEEKFEQWVNNNPEIAAELSGLINEFEETYRLYHPYRFAFRLYFETGRNIELVRFAGQFNRLVNLSMNSETDEETLRGEVLRMQDAAERFFRDYHAPVDREIMTALLEHYTQRSQQGYMPPVLEEINNRHKGNFDDFTHRVFRRSMFASKESTLAFLENYRARDHRKITRDPAYSLASGLIDFVTSDIQAPMQMAQNTLDSLYRVYTASLKEIYPDSLFFPDANGTLRITYGRVEGSYPRDAIRFLPYTTANGILEKAAQREIEDYRISERLQYLLDNRVYGDYASEDELAVNFVASNHTTGGNSGSPVLDSQGNFIGINFDRSWESTMSDIMFDPEQCRNISVNSRYILWVIDKYAGMGYLLDEMKIVN